MKSGLELEINIQGEARNMKIKGKTYNMKYYLNWILAGIMVLGILASQEMVLAKDVTWRKMADMPTARNAFTTSVVDGKIYAIGGFAGDLFIVGMSTVEVYDPATDTWEERAKMPTKRLTAAASVVNGKIYVIGGYSGGRLPSVYEYDPVEDTWERKAPMPTSRNWHATALVDGKIYAMGGWEANWVSNSVYEYDPETDTWTRKADMPTGRWGLSAGVANGKIYAIGGAIGFNPERLLSAVEEYDPVTDTWVKKADMPAPRAWIANHSPTVNGRIYVVGGWTAHGGVGLTGLEEYDPVTDTWSKKDDMPTGRGSLAAIAIGGKLYAMGGANLFQFHQTVEEYDTSFAGQSQAVGPMEKLMTMWGKIRGQH